MNKRETESGIITKMINFFNMQSDKHERKSQKITRDRSLARDRGRYNVNQQHLIVLKYQGTKCEEIFPYEKMSLKRSKKRLRMRKQLKRD